MWRERKDVRAGNSAREKIRERRPVDGKLPRRFRDWRDWRKQNLEYESRKVNFFPGRKCYVRPWATTSKFNPKRHVTLRFRERRTEIVLLFSFLSVFFFFLSYRIDGRKKRDLPSRWLAHDTSNLLTFTERQQITLSWYFGVSRCLSYI